MERKTQIGLSFLLMGISLLALIFRTALSQNPAFSQGASPPKVGAQRNYAPTTQRILTTPGNKVKELQEILTRLRNRRAVLVASIKKMNVRQKEIELRLKNLYLQLQQSSLQPSERSALENLIAFEKSRIQQITTRRRLLIKELDSLLSAERQLQARKIVVPREKNL